MMMMMTRRLVGWRDGMRENGRWKGRGWKLKNDDDNNDDDFGSSMSCVCVCELDLHWRGAAL
jgi:hypothetical protein